MAKIEPCRNYEQVLFQSAMFKQDPEPHIVIIVLCCPSVMETWSSDVRENCTTCIKEWKTAIWKTGGNEICLVYLGIVTRKGHVSITRAEAEEYDQSFVIC